jgi:2-phosphosulfolactate phosphatase
MLIKYYTLEDCHLAEGIVVVIDVMRAFTTAAYALSAGANEIHLVGTVQQALDLQQNLAKNGPVRLIGESGGLQVEAFDFDNSPSQLAQADLAGRQIIQRTTNGTQGMIRSTSAQVLLGGSFVVAHATLEYLNSLNPSQVSLVITGDRPGYRAVEDWACGEYLAAALSNPPGKTPDPAPYLRAARGWQPSAAEYEMTRIPYIRADLALSIEIDRFPFGLLVERREKQRLVLTACHS